MEVQRKGTTYFMKASIPEEDVQDVRAMLHEKIIAPQTAGQLYDALPVLHPTVGFALTAMPGLEDSFKMDPTLFDALPTFSWSDLLALAKRM